MSNEKEATAHKQDSMETRIRLALRFGWTIVAVYGRLKQGMLWKRTAPKAPRLFISHFDPTSGEELWTETRRLLAIAETLFDGADLAPPPLIAGLPATMEALIREEKEALPPEDEIFRALNHWSRRCWAALDTEDTIIAEAGSLGGSLADTFWHLQPYWDRTEPAPSETLEGMLNSERLIKLIRKIRHVEPYLPKGFGQMLRHSLWEWDVMNDLTRDALGELKIAYPLLYNMRSWQWVRRWRERRMKKKGIHPPDLKAKERERLWKRMQTQVTVWNRLVFDRSVNPMMRPTDWRWVRWISCILYAIFAALLIGAGMAVFVGLVIGGRWAVTRVFQTSPPSEFQDWLALGSASVAVVTFLITQLRNGAHGLRQLYRWVYDWVFARKMDQRTLTAWNGEEKPVFWIAIQRWLRAEDT